MKIYYLSKEGYKHIDDPIVACIGYFDGLHLGHQALIRKTIELSKMYDTKKAMITFYPDPKDVITSKEHRHIQDFSDRLKIAEEMGIDIAIVYEFTKELCMTTEHAFFKEILCDLDLKALVCGFDFSYGYKGSGNATSLKMNAKGRFEVEVIPEVMYENEKISSTRVRLAIEKGEIELANKLLGYTYFNRGIVCHGKRNGHKLGFPTANIKLDKEILCPRHGVYIGYVKYEGKIYKAMINIGNNPTISQNNGVTYEVNILDFDEDIYDKEIIVYLVKRIRDDIRFESLDKLKEQLIKDRMCAEALKEDGRFIL